MSSHRLRTLCLVALSTSLTFLVIGDEPIPTAAAQEESSDEVRAPSEAKQESSRYAPPVDLVHQQRLKTWHYAQQYEEALDGMTELNLVGQPFAEAIDFLAQQNHVPILIDEAALGEVGIALDTPIADLVISKISFRSALELLFEQVSDELTWVIEDEVMKITTKLETEAGAETHVYHVDGLVSAGYSSEELTEMLQSMVDVESWDKERGIGKIVGGNGALVIHQAQPVHREIIELLELLHMHASDAF